MKRHLYGAATMIVALATLASSGTALAQNATSTSGHDHGNWNGGSSGNWNRGGNNNNWNHGGNNNWNRGGNWGGSNGNNWGQWGHNNWGRWGQQRHHGNFYGFGNRGFWFGGQEYIYTG